VNCNDSNDAKQGEQKKDNAKLTETETDFNDLLVSILIIFFSLIPTRLETTSNLQSV